MNLSEVAAISGKSGLFRVMKPGKFGVMLVSLEDPAVKVVANAKNRISTLGDISIYTTTAEGSVPLIDVLKAIFKKLPSGFEGKDVTAEWQSFMKAVLPDYDADRVHISDIRKLAKWYAILKKACPELLAEPSEQSPS